LKNGSHYLQVTSKVTSLMGQVTSQVTSHQSSKFDLIIGLNVHVKPQVKSLQLWNMAAAFNFLLLTPHFKLTCYWQLL
jgi:hypothetical protein